MDNAPTPTPPDDARERCAAAAGAVLRRLGFTIAYPAGQAVLMDIADAVLAASRPTPPAPAADGVTLAEAVLAYRAARDAFYDWASDYEFDLSDAKPLKAEMAKTKQAMFDAAEAITAALAARK